MAENDFYVLNGNRYRGSRYATFAGGGVDAQGNVSSAVNENAANDIAQSGNRPTINPTDVSAQQTSGVGVQTPKPQAPVTLGGAAKDFAIGAAVPAAATTIGTAAGGSIATGAGFGETLSMGTSGLLNKVSGGLLGTTSSATNTALAGMGGKFGPATQSAVNKAALGNTAGGAFGSGIGTFAATLLTGGSLKDAAIGGVGSGIGFAIGNTILPGAGGFIGSTLGSLVGGLFGGDIKRQTVSATFSSDPKTGKIRASDIGGKGTDGKSRSKYVNSITGILNSFSDAVGLKYNTKFRSESNIGKKDPKTTLGWNKEVISKNRGDTGAVALGVLKNTKNYSMGEDQSINDFWTQNVGKAKSIQQLGSLVDDFLKNRNNGPSPSLVAMRNEGKSKFNFAS